MRLAIEESYACLKSFTATELLSEIKMTLKNCKIVIYLLQEDNAVEKTSRAMLKDKAKKYERRISSRNSKLMEYNFSQSK
jgi:hypothetical protein